MVRRMAFGTILLVVLVMGCLGGSDSNNQKLSQTGSSTVLPLAIVWAEEFDGADISVSGGGSSHGLNSLLMGEADLGDASRLMKGSDYEKVGCEKEDVKEDGTTLNPCNGVKPQKWVVAYDVLVVVINNENSWAQKLTYEQLYRIFTDDSPAVYWDEVSGLDGAPHEKIDIYAPDEASGTYDFFFEEIIPSWGKEDQRANTRLDLGDGIYHPSADDNVILNAVKDNRNAIGFFGFAYYTENPTMVKPVQISKKDAVFEQATLENVAGYPLARPLYIYTDGIPQRGDVLNDYLGYVLSLEGQEIVEEVGYVRLSLIDEQLITAQEKTL